mmetsp:Transcript_36483/g.86983  ORF Transcript_36483/g.86983 Transcript_36483/m.86983 type:complete len:315 (-) Transcript_36483:93-1037(-)
MGGPRRDGRRLPRAAGGLLPAPRATPPRRRLRRRGRRERGIGPRRRRADGQASSDAHAGRRGDAPVDLPPVRAAPQVPREGVRRQGRRGETSRPFEGRIRRTISCGTIGSRALRRGRGRRTRLRPPPVRHRGRPRLARRRLPPPPPLLGRRGGRGRGRRRGRLHDGRPARGVPRAAGGREPGGAVPEAREDGQDPALEQGGEGNLPRRRGLRSPRRRVRSPRGRDRPRRRRDFAQRRVRRAGRGGDLAGLLEARAGRRGGRAAGHHAPRDGRPLPRRCPPSAKEEEEEGEVGQGGRGEGGSGGGNGGGIPPPRI